MYTALQMKEHPYVSIRDMSDFLNMPFHFLTKVLQELTKKGVLISSRGPSGGIALARPPEEITLMEIIEVVDGPAMFRHCLLGLEGCNDAKPCPLHRTWGPERERLKALFANTHVSDIINDAAQHYERMIFDNLPMPSRLKRKPRRKTVVIGAKRRKKK